ncbi:hypothetical protein EVG20_g10458 [Dentipellis fragilis]|uniref:Uncharacterized protein n=1 Tax=Dentipellis fragilis TaxID=205917 RepID=A0A4Y9XRF5_9AGAM|nr:hypothetical protein EVG20_g10458 [Dentipellis fragilis]
MLARLALLSFVLTAIAAPAPQGYSSVYDYPPSSVDAYDPPSSTDAYDLPTSTDVYDGPLNSAFPPPPKPSYYGEGDSDRRAVVEDINDLLNSVLDDLQNGL